MPTQNELEGSVEFVIYELWMLLACAEMPPPADRVARNLWYEGLVLHSRVLRDFFFTKVGKNGKRITHDSDLVAVDYFVSPKAWSHTSAKLPEYLAENKERMDRAVAHLSIDRITFQNQDKNWDATKLKLEIFEAWFEFFQLLSGDNPTAAEWFRSNHRMRTEFLDRAKFDRRA